MQCPRCQSNSVEYQAGISSDLNFRQYHCLTCHHDGKGSLNTPEEMVWRVPRPSAADAYCPHCGNGVIVINPGSVGQPPVTDPQPRYAIMDTTSGAVRVESIDFHVDESLLRSVKPEEGG